MVAYAVILSMIIIAPAMMDIREKIVKLVSELREYKAFPPFMTPRGGCLQVLTLFLTVSFRVACLV